MGRFDGKVVLVTGAARGQGRSHAEAFAREGADVAICDISGQIGSVSYPHGDPKEIATTARAVEDLGASVLADVVDVRDQAAVEAFAAKAIATFGKIDICIANAGIASFGPLDEMPEDQFQDMIDINLTGVWHTFKAVVPHMKERRYGRLIATASVASVKPFANAGHYTAAKHGVVGLVKALALETADYGITANWVCPGNIGTDMILNQSMYEYASPDEPTQAAFEAAFGSLNAQPGTWMDAVEISNAMLFIASDEASKMTGSQVVVDMGMMIN